jgi:hypothetical protein
MMSEEHKWEDVDLTEPPASLAQTKRMKVPGGWLYKHQPPGQTWAIVFVPERQPDP